jgi:hypothetical protein
VEEAPAPTTKPAGVLGAALAALMMVRPAAARRAAPRARIARTRLATRGGASRRRTPGPR